MLNIANKVCLVSNRLSQKCTQSISLLLPTWLLQFHTMETLVDLYLPTPSSSVPKIGNFSCLLVLISCQPLCKRVSIIKMLTWYIDIFLIETLFTRMLTQCVNIILCSGFEWQPVDSWAVWSPSSAYINLVLNKAFLNVICEQNFQAHNETRDVSWWSNQILTAFSGWCLAAQWPPVGVRRWRAAAHLQSKRLPHPHSQSKVI